MSATNTELILFTGYKPQSDRAGVPATAKTYMRLHDEMAKGKYGHLRVAHIDIKELAESGKLDSLRATCKKAFIVVHIGSYFEDQMLRHGAKMELIREAHSFILDSMPQNSLCRLERVWPERCPSYKPTQYQTIKGLKLEDRVPLIDSYSFDEIEEKHADGKAEEMLPLVFKLPWVHEGQGCFLIETKEQLAKVLDPKLYDQAQDLGIAPDEHPYHRVKANSVFQSYVKGPMEGVRRTYARIQYHSSSQKVLGLSLFHAEESDRKVELPHTPTFNSSNLFCHPESPLNLQAKAIRPTSTERKEIAVYPRSEHAKLMAAEDQTIMELHGLQAGKLPAELDILCKTFGSWMHGTSGIIAIDVIYDAKEKVWRLIGGDFPASRLFKDFYGYGTQQKSVDIRIEKEAQGLEDLVSGAAGLA